MANHQNEVKNDDNTHCAFFYGTLMAPEVFYTICYSQTNVDLAIQSLHTFTPAVLHGYCRRRVEGAEYPGITPDDSHQVLGEYVTGLTKANMQKLDYFEGSQYERRTVRVKVLKKVGDAATGEGNVEGEEREALVYVFTDKDKLEDREWDFEEFRKEKMKNWTRAGFAFDGCNENDLAVVVDKPDEI